MAPEVFIFPRARNDRSEPQQIVGQPTVAQAPIVRLWPFALEEITPGDRQAASPFLNGPAVIDYIFINAQNDNTAPIPTISMFYGPTVPPTGNAPVAGVSALGTPIFTDSVISTETGNKYQGPIQHISKFSGDVLTLHLVIPLRFPIMLDQFQILVRFGTQGGGSQSLAGHVRILERVPREQIPNFL